MKLYNEMEKAFLEIEKRFDTHSLEKFLDCPYPVSYTHLDVYKRQVVHQIQLFCHGWQQRTL